MLVETPNESGVNTQDVDSSSSASADTSDTPVSSSELESRVGDSLAEIFGEVADDAGTEDGAEPQPAGEYLEDTSGKDDTDTATDSAEKPPATPAAPAPKAPATPVIPPSIPAAYVRSLKALEWTDAEIAEAAKSPAFVTTAAKLHDTRNKELAGWANLGRQQAEASKTRAGDPNAPSGLQVLKPIDAAPIKAQYGEDALIDSLVGPINDTIAQINQIIPVIQQTQERSQYAELETLSRQVDGFFASDGVKPYKDFYGLDSKTPDAAQIEVRNKVISLANDLIIGAQIQGRTLSLNDALFAAHDSVSAGYRQEAARKQVQGSVRQRNNSISLRPSASGSPANSGGKSSTAGGLEAKVAQGLKAIFRT